MKYPFLVTAYKLLIMETVGTVTLSGIMFDNEEHMKIPLCVGNIRQVLGKNSLLAAQGRIFHRDCSTPGSAVSLLHNDPLEKNVEITS